MTGTGVLYLGSVATAGILSSCEVHETRSKVAGGARHFITPTDGDLSDDFFVQFGGNTATQADHPIIDRADWRLEITGDVNSPVTVTWDDLTAAAEDNAMLYLKTMRCVLEDEFNSYISNGYWRGVPLHHFIEMAEPDDDAVRLRITGEDGFTNNLRLARVMDDISLGVGATVPLLPVILAYELNGESIPSVHGGPVRILVPEKFGFKCCKWPREIELTSSDAPFGTYEIGLFDGDPYTDTGNMGLVSRFSSPTASERVQGPEVTFHGIALYGPGEVERVEISIDRAPFEPVRLVTLEELYADPTRFFFGVQDGEVDRRQEELDGIVAELEQTLDLRFRDTMPFVWTLWTHTVELPVGGHTARVRAFASDGTEQPNQDLEPADGNSEIREITFDVT